ncbi:hypothetical protein OCB69_22260, partial [Bacillus cereus]|nr:hypothetical protein [Bacillus cereus]
VGTVKLASLFPHQTINNYILDKPMYLAQTIYTDFLTEPYISKIADIFSSGNQYNFIYRKTII